MRKQGQPTIQESAIKKAVDGLTSVEEILRLSGEAQPAPAAAATLGGASAPAPAGAGKAS
jgi:hypothetical protein